MQKSYHMKISKMKLSEISAISRVQPPNISRFFKNHDDTKVNRINNRIMGVTGDAIEEYLKSLNILGFYRPAIILSANLCGGVGKTTSILNLGIALRRITTDDTPIVFVDGDSQASFTSIICGSPAEDNEPILINFLEGKVGIDDVLYSAGNNIWIVKSNLNQAFIEKVLSKPQEIKKGILRFYEAVFEKLGNKTKIFQDHTPQLSNLFASSICALNQLDDSFLKAVLIPIRSDKFAIQGADYILREISDLNETFSLPDTIDKHCFFSSIDKRVSTTAEALKIASTKEIIVKHLSSIVIRYCAEVPKGIMSGSNVYNDRKGNNAAEDYLDLLNNIFNYNKSK